MIPSMSVAFFVASSLMVASVESGASNEYHEHRPRRSVESPDAMKLETLDKHLMAMSNMRGLGQRRSDLSTVAPPDAVKPSSASPDMLFERAAAPPSVTPSNPTVSFPAVPQVTVKSGSSVTPTQLPPVTHPTTAPAVNGSEDGQRGCSHPKDLKCKKNFDGTTVSVVRLSIFPLRLFIGFRC